MLKTQTKKIKNRKVSKIIAGILSLLMFATSNGSFLVWGLSEGQLNFLGEPAVAQAKTAEAKVIETADAITVDEILEDNQTANKHWWEFWKKQNSNDVKSVKSTAGFSDLKTELVAREVLGDKTVDALGDDLKTGKNDLTSKESKNKISFLKKLWANFVGMFNKDLKTSILENIDVSNDLEAQNAIYLDVNTEEDIYLPVRKAEIQTTLPSGEKKVEEAFVVRWPDGKWQMLDPEIASSIKIDGDEGSLVARKAEIQTTLPSGEKKVEQTLGIRLPNGTWQMLEPKITSKEKKSLLAQSWEKFKGWFWGDENRAEITYRDIGDERKKIVTGVIARNPYIHVNDMAKDSALRELPFVYETMIEPYTKAIESGRVNKSAVDRLLNDVAEQATIVTRNLYFQKKPITEKNTFDELRNINVTQKEVEDLPLFNNRKVFVLANNEKIDSELAKKYRLPDNKIDTSRFAPDKFIYNIQRQTAQPVNFQLAKNKKDLDEKDIKTLLEEFSNGKEPSTFIFNGHGDSNDKLYYTNDTTLSAEDLFNAYKKRWENRQPPTKLSDRDIIILSSCYSSNFLRDFMELCEKNNVPKPIVTSESEYGQYGTSEVATSQYNNHFLDIINDKKTTLGSIIKINKTNPNNNPIIYIPDEKENTRQVTDIKQYATGNQDEFYADSTDDSTRYNPITGEAINIKETLAAQEQQRQIAQENKSFFSKVADFFARYSVADPTDDNKIQKGNAPETGEVVYYQDGVKLMTADTYAKYTKKEGDTGLWDKFTSWFGGNKDKQITEQEAKDSGLDPVSSEKIAGLGGGEKDKQIIERGVNNVGLDSEIRQDGGKRFDNNKNTNFKIDAHNLIEDGQAKLTRLYTTDDDTCPAGERCRHLVIADSSFAGLSRVLGQYGDKVQVAGMYDLTGGQHLLDEINNEYDSKKDLTVLDENSLFESRHGTLVASTYLNSFMDSHVSNVDKIYLKFVKIPFNERGDEAINTALELSDGYDFHMSIGCLSPGKCLTDKTLKYQKKFKEIAEEKGRRGELVTVSAGNNRDKGGEGIVISGIEFRKMSPSLITFSSVKRDEDGSPIMMPFTQEGDFYTLGGGGGAGYGFDADNIRADELAHDMALAYVKRSRNEDEEVSFCMGGTGKNEEYCRNVYKQNMEMLAQQHMPEFKKKIEKYTGTKNEGTSFTHTGITLLQQLREEPIPAEFDSNHDNKWQTSELKRAFKIKCLDGECGDDIFVESQVKPPIDSDLERYGFKKVTRSRFDGDDVGEIYLEKSINNGKQVIRLSQEDLESMTTEDETNLLAYLRAAATEKDDKKGFFSGVISFFTAKSDNEDDKHKQYISNLKNIQLDSDKDLPVGEIVSSKKKYSKFVEDGNGGLRKLTPEEFAQKESEYYRQKIKLDPTNPSQQSAKLKAIEKKNSWLSKVNPLNWFGGNNDKQITEQEAKDLGLDSGLGESITGLGNGENNYAIKADKIGEYVKDAGEKIRSEMLQEVKSDAYLKRLTIEFDGNEDRARKFRQYRIEYLENSDIKIVDDKDKVFDEYGKNKPVALYEDGKIYVNKDLAKESPLDELGSTVLPHEFGHAITDGGIGITSKTSKLIQSSVKSEEEWLKDASSHSKEVGMAYFIIDDEVYTRLRFVRKDLEKYLGVKYKTEVKQEDIKKLLEMSKSGEAQLNKNTQQIFETIQESKIPKLLNEIADTKQYATGNQDEFYADSTDDSTRYNPITGEAINIKEILAAQEQQRQIAQENKSFFSKVADFFARYSVADPTDDNKIQKGNAPETGEVVYYQDGVKLMTADKYAEYTKKESKKAREEAQANQPTVQLHSAETKFLDKEVLQQANESEVEEKKSVLSSIWSKVTGFFGRDNKKGSGEKTRKNYVERLATDGEQADGAVGGVDARDIAGSNLPKYLLNPNKESGSFNNKSANAPTKQVDKSRTKDKKGWRDTFTSWFGGNKDKQITEQEAKDSGLDPVFSEKIAGIGENDKNNSSYDDLVAKYGKDDMMQGFTDEELAGLDKQTKNIRDNVLVTGADRNKVSFVSGPIVMIDADHTLAEKVLMTGKKFIVYTNRDVKDGQLPGRDSEKLDAQEQWLLRNAPSNNYDYIELPNGGIIAEKDGLSEFLIPKIDSSTGGLIGNPIKKGDQGFDKALRSAKRRYHYEPSGGGENSGRGVEGVAKSNPVSRAEILETRFSYSGKKVDVSGDTSSIVALKPDGRKIRIKKVEKSVLSETSSGRVSDAGRAGLEFFKLINPDPVVYKIDKIKTDTLIDTMDKKLGIKSGKSKNRKMSDNRGNALYYNSEGKLMYSIGTDEFGKAYIKDWQNKVKIDNTKLIKEGAGAVEFVATLFGENKIAGVAGLVKEGVSGTDGTIGVVDTLFAWIPFVGPLIVNNTDRGLKERAVKGAGELLGGDITKAYNTITSGNDWDRQVEYVKKEMTVTGVAKDVFEGTPVGKVLKRIAPEELQSATLRALKSIEQNGDIEAAWNLFTSETGAETVRLTDVAKKAIEKDPTEFFANIAQQTGNTEAQLVAEVVVAAKELYGSVNKETMAKAQGEIDKQSVIVLDRDKKALSGDELDKYYKNEGYTIIKNTGAATSKEGMRFLKKNGMIVGRIAPDESGQDTVFYFSKSSSVGGKTKVVLSSVKKMASLLGEAGVVDPKVASAVALGIELSNNPNKTKQQIQAGNSDDIVALVKKYGGEEGKKITEIYSNGKKIIVGAGNLAGDIDKALKANDKDKNIFQKMFGVASDNVEIFGVVMSEDSAKKLKEVLRGGNSILKTLEKKNGVVYVKTNKGMFSLKDGKLKAITSGDVASIRTTTALNKKDGNMEKSSQVKEKSGLFGLIKKFFTGADNALEESVNGATRSLERLASNSQDYVQEINDVTRNKPAVEREISAKLSVKKDTVGLNEFEQYEDSYLRGYIPEEAYEEFLKNGLKEKKVSADQYDRFLQIKKARLEKDVSSGVYDSKTIEKKKNELESINKKIEKRVSAEVDEVLSGGLFNGGGSPEDSLTATPKNNKNEKDDCGFWCTVKRVFSFGSSDGKKGDAEEPASNSVVAPEKEQRNKFDSTVDSDHNGDYKDEYKVDNSSGRAIVKTTSDSSDSVDGSTKASTKPPKEEKGFWSRINPFKLLFGKEEKTVYEQAGDKFISDIEKDVDKHMQDSTENENIVSLPGDVVDDLKDMQKDEEVKVLKVVYDDGRQSLNVEYNRATKLYQDEKGNEYTLKYGFGKTSGLVRHSGVADVDQDSSSDDDGVLSDLVENAFGIEGQPFNSDVLKLYSKFKLKEIDSALTADDGYKFSDFLKNGVLGGLSKSANEINNLGDAANSDDILKILGSDIIEESVNESARQIFGEVGLDDKRHLNWFRQGTTDMTKGLISGLIMGDVDRLPENITKVVGDMAMASMEAHGIISKGASNILSDSSNEITAGFQDIVNGDFDTGTRVIAGGITSSYLNSALHSTFGDSMGTDIAGIAGSDIIMQVARDGKVNWNKVGKDTALAGSKIATRYAVNKTIENLPSVQRAINTGVAAGQTRSVATSSALGAYGGWVAAAVAVASSVGTQYAETHQVDGGKVIQGTITATLSYYGMTTANPYLTGAAVLLNYVFKKANEHHQEWVKKIVKEELNVAFDSTENLSVAGVPLSTIQKAAHYINNNQAGTARTLIDDFLKTTPLGAVESATGVDDAINAFNALLTNYIKGTYTDRTKDDPSDFLSVKSRTFSEKAFSDVFPDGGIVNLYISEKNRLRDCYNSGDSACIEDVALELHNHKKTVKEYFLVKFNTEIAKLQNEINELTKKINELNKELENANSEAEKEVINSKKEKLTQKVDILENKVNNLEEARDYVEDTLDGSTDSKSETKDYNSKSWLKSKCESKGEWYYLAGNLKCVRKSCPPKSKFGNYGVLDKNTGKCNYSNQAHGWDEPPVGY